MKKIIACIVPYRPPENKMNPITVFCRNLLLVTDHKNKITDEERRILRQYLDIVGKDPNFINHLTTEINEITKTLSQLPSSSASQRTSLNRGYLFLCFSALIFIVRAAVNYNLKHVHPLDYEKNNLMPPTSTTVDLTTHEETFTYKYVNSAPINATSFYLILPFLMSLGASYLYTLYQNNLTNMKERTDKKNFQEDLRCNINLKYFLQNQRHKPTENVSSKNVIICEVIICEDGYLSEDTEEFLNNIAALPLLDDGSDSSKTTESSGLTASIPPPKKSRNRRKSRRGQRSSSPKVRHKEQVSLFSKAQNIENKWKEERKSFGEIRFFTIVTYGKNLLVLRIAIPPGKRKNFTDDQIKQIDSAINNGLVSSTGKSGIKTITYMNKPLRYVKLLGTTTRYFLAPISEHNEENKTGHTKTIYYRLYKDPNLEKKLHNRF